MSFKTSQYLTAALCLTQAMGLDAAACALFAAGLGLISVALTTR